MTAVRVKTATGWQDIAIQGPAGSPGSQSPLSIAQVDRSPKLARILNKFLDSGTGLAVGRSGTTYSLYRGISPGLFAKWDLVLDSAEPGGYALHQMQGLSVIAPQLSVPYGDASVASSGTFTTAVLAGAYNGGYAYAAGTAGPSKTFTTPANTTTIGVRFPTFTNGGGWWKVSIDGDSTLADALLTAQDAVTANLLDSTVLVANGGTLNPTDRVFDTYANSIGTQNPDTRIGLAAGLTPGVHTVVLTYTGYNRKGISSQRAYLSGFTYGTASSQPSDASSIPITITSLCGQVSAWEHAESFLPAGATTPTFLGNVHGYEVEDSFVITIDGTVTTLTDGQIAAASREAKLTRVSHLLHPETGATVVADVTVDYIIGRYGLTVHDLMTWRVAGTRDKSYMMMPLNGILSNVPQATKFGRADLLDWPGGPLTFTGASDTYYGASKSAAVWAWGGKFGVLMNMPDAESYTSYWSLSDPYYTRVEDRNGGMTKFYIPRTWATADPIVAGAVTDRTSTYTVGYFPAGAEATLGVKPADAPRRAFDAVIDGGLKADNGVTDNAPLLAALRDLVPAGSVIEFPTQGTNWYGFGDTTGLNKPLTLRGNRGLASPISQSVGSVLRPLSVSALAPLKPLFEVTANYVEIEGLAIDGISATESNGSTSGTTVIQLSSLTAASWMVGCAISGTNIPSLKDAPTTIVSVDTVNNRVTISPNAATGSGSGLTFRILSGTGIKFGAGSHFSKTSKKTLVRQFYRGIEMGAGSDHIACVGGGAPGNYDNVFFAHGNLFDYEFSENYDLTGCLHSGWRLEANTSTQNLRADRVHFGFGPYGIVQDATTTGDGYDGVILDNSPIEYVSQQHIAIVNGGRFKVNGGYWGWNGTPAKVAFEISGLQDFGPIDFAPELLANTPNPNSPSVISIGNQNGFEIDTHGMPLNGFAQKLLPFNAYIGKVVDGSAFFNGALLQTGSTTVLTAQGRAQFNNALQFNPATKTGTYATANTDNWIRATSGTWTLTLTPTSTKQFLMVTNEGTGVITIATSVNGPGSLAAGQSAIFASDGASWRCISQWARAATVQQRVVTDLVEPWVLPHRMGGANIAPDNALSAMDAAVALGSPVTDGGDLRALADGTLVTCHDATIDRTMSGTGNVADQTAQSWKTLALDPSTYGFGTWPNETPAYFTDILDRARRAGVVITPECKSNQPAPQNMVALIQRYGLTNSVIFQSFTLSDLAFATAAGMKTCYLVTSAIAPSVATAAGVNYVGYDYTQAFATSTWIASLVAAGLKPFPYNVIRKTDWATQRGYGAVCAASDDPFYIAATNPSLANDPFKSQTWSHGMFDLGSPSAARGSFGAPKWWLIDMAGDKLVHQGWVRLPAAFTLTFRVRFDAIGAGGGTAVVVCGTNDLTMASSSGTGLGTGYMLYILPQAGNQLRLYRKNGDNTQTQLAAVNGTAITVDGTEATFQIVVTATTIKCDRTDVPVSLTLVTDNTYRGEHLALGKQGADSRNAFADLLVA